MVNSIRFLFCIMACFFSISTYADWASDREAQIRQNRINYAQKVYGMSNAEATKKVDAGLSAGKVKQSASFEGTSPDGSKIRAGATVTKSIETAKVASTLAERLKTAQKYAKNLGKASLPSFVGTAAFHALMNGVDYVMDPENNTIQKPNPDADSFLKGQYYYSVLNHSRSYSNSPAGACSKEGQAYTPVQSWTYSTSSGTYGSCTKPDSSTVVVSRHNNPDYDPDFSIPARVAATDAEIVEALKKALESNNTALATAIAEAIKAAYSPDVSEGQNIEDSATNGLSASSNADIKNAVTNAANNNGTEASSNGEAGHYKITDGDKTIEGYVTPSDTSGQTTTDSESTTVTDPTTGNQTTTGTSSGSLQFPAFCDWASIVCDWIGWTKEEPAEPEIEPPVIEQIDIPFVPFSITQFNASCPPDQNLSMNLMGTEQSFVLPMTPFCDFFSSIKPFVIACASFFAVKLIGNGAFNSGN